MVVRKRELSMRGNRIHSMFFVRPRVMQNADMVANNLAQVDRVKEVILSSGEFGYVVSSESSGAGEVRQIRREISRIAKCRMVSCITKHRLYGNKPKK